MDFSALKQTVLDKLGVKGLVAVAATVFLALFTGVWLYVSSAQEEKFLDVLYEKGLDDAISYEDFSYNLFSSTSTLENVEVNLVALLPVSPALITGNYSSIPEFYLTMDSVTLKDFSDDKDSAEVDITLNNIDLPQELFKEAGRSINKLTSLGYIEAKPSLHIKLEADKRSGEQLITLGLSDRTMGSARLETDLKLTGKKSEKDLKQVISNMKGYSSPRNVVLGLLQNITVNEVQFEYEDEGLLARYLENERRKLLTVPGEEVETIFSEADKKALVKTVRKNKLSGDIAEDIADFVESVANGSDDISVSVEPKRPVKLSRVVEYIRKDDFKRLFKELNLSFDA